MVPALRLVFSDRSPGGGIPGEYSGRSPKNGNGHKRKTSILVVEVEILIRLAIADYLREAGYRVLEASNASEAVSVFAVGEPIELMFSDIHMPGAMNGVALADWVRRQFPDVKVLLTAGVSMEANGGVVDTRETIVRKPYSLDAITAQIGRLLAP